ncbi:hypothetical protein R6Q57_011348 [Mikania cordata]
MAKTRVLFCGPHFPASHNFTKEYLQNYPLIQVDDLPFDSIPDLIGNYDICVVKSMRLTSDVVARATRMKLIMQYGVGLEGIDIDAATNHGIKVARIPSGKTGNAASCAEMAIYFMLGLLRKHLCIYSCYSDFVRNRENKRNQRIDFRKSVCVENSFSRYRLSSGIRAAVLKSFSLKLKDGGRSEWKSE